MKTLILFDVDGTLVYSERRDSRAFAATYELLYRRPFPTLDWSRFAHVTDTTIFGTLIDDHFGRAPTEAEVEYFQHFYLDRLRENRRLRPDRFREVPGARDLVRRLLDDARYEVGVATGGWAQPARIKLAHIGIPADHLFLSGADGKTTREEILGAVIRKAAAHSGPFRRIVYVGDAVWDVRTTRNLQLSFVGIRYRNDCDLLHRAGATHVLADYRDPALFLEAAHRAGPPAAGFI